MTREDAYALGNIIHQEVITFYESQFNEIFKMLVDSAKNHEVNLVIKTNAEMWKILADYDYQVSARDLKINFIIFW